MSQGSKRENKIQNYYYFCIIFYSPCKLGCDVIRKKERKKIFLWLWRNKYFFPSKTRCFSVSIKHTNTFFCFLLLTKSYLYICICFAYCIYFKYLCFSKWNCTIFVSISLFLWTLSSSYNRHQAYSHYWLYEEKKKHSHIFLAFVSFSSFFPIFFTFPLTRPIAIIFIHELLLFLLQESS